MLPTVHDPSGRTETPRGTRLLWLGAALTTVGVGLFPRLNAVIYEHVPIWRLDPEAQVLLPAGLLLSLLVFATLGRWACRAGGHTNRPARVGLVTGVLGILGVLVFFLSLPILLGGLAVTLGVEGRLRAATEGRLRRANLAIGLGLLAVVIGAAIWLFAGGD